MLDNLATFPYSFGIAWTLWLVWICYSYGVFVIVAGFYFGSIRRNMKRVAGLDSKLVERVSLQRAWYFATATSIIVTITGLVYGGAALYVTVWTAESLTVKKVSLKRRGPSFSFMLTSRSRLSRRRHSSRCESRY